jgi:hypothetical protein
VKRDLDEFSVAMSSQASSVVSSTATVLKDKLKVGIDKCVICQEIKLNCVMIICSWTMRNQQLAP